MVEQRLSIEAISIASQQREAWIETSEVPITNGTHAGIASQQREAWIET